MYLYINKHITYVNSNFSCDNLGKKLLQDITNACIEKITNYRRIVAFHILMSKNAQKLFAIK